MEQNLVDALVSGGPVAILAAFIFIMYVRDRKSSQDCQREDRKFMEDRLTKLLEDDQKSREVNTRALTELTIVLRTMNEHRS